MPGRESHCGWARPNEATIARACAQEVGAHSRPKPDHPRPDQRGGDAAAVRVPGGTVQDHLKIGRAEAEVEGTKRRSERHKRAAAWGRQEGPPGRGKRKEERRGRKKASLRPGGGKINKEKEKQKATPLMPRRPTPPPLL